MKRLRSGRTVAAAGGEGEIPVKDQRKRREEVVTAVGHWFTGTQEEGGEKEGTADKERPKKTGVLGKSTATHSGRRIAASLLTTHTHTHITSRLNLHFNFFKIF